MDKNFRNAKEDVLIKKDDKEAEDSNKYVTWTTKITKKHKKRLSIIAIENETTIKNILNKIIDEYLERSRK
jgi:hypothetical protein